MNVNVKVLFLRPPRHYWPILNEQDNYLLPLAYPTLAGYVREHEDGVEFDILDCCAHSMGWKSLRRYIQEKNPDIVAIGEKVCFAHEADRAFQLVKEVNPKIVTIAGGVFYSHVVEDSLRKNRAIDYIIRFEGEIAFLEFIRAFRKGKDFSSVPNICYLNNESLVQNSLAPLIDMTKLPVPAYDIAHIDKYKPFGKLWPKAITVQRSRGCTNNCTYCSWIAQESLYSMNGSQQLVRKSVFRSKTPEQMVQEIELLYEKYGIRYLFWVDASWNYDDEWLNVFCDELIRRKYQLGWWAFVRLDFIKRQHENGTLKKMVRAGLRHILSGADRCDSDDMTTLNKANHPYLMVKEALHLFRDHYPEVFRQCTIITGLPNDNAEKIKALLKYAHDIDLDFAAFHTVSPFPGTPLYEEAKASGLLMNEDFSNYDMYFPVMKTRYLSQEEVAYWTTWCQYNFVAKKPFKYLSRLFSPHLIRRKLHWWFSFSIGRVMMHQAMNHIKGIERFQGFSGVNKLWRPSWYDS